jgi:hypothetical protein
MLVGPHMASSPQVGDVCCRWFLETRQEGSLILSLQPGIFSKGCPKLKRAQLCIQTNMKHFQQLF